MRGKRYPIETSSHSIVRAASFCIAPGGQRGFYSKLLLIYLIARPVTVVHFSNFYGRLRHLAAAEYQCEDEQHKCGNKLFHRTSSTGSDVRGELQSSCVSVLNQRRGKGLPSTPRISWSRRRESNPQPADYKTEPAQKLKVRYANKCSVHARFVYKQKKEKSQ